MGIYIFSAVAATISEEWMTLILPDLKTQLENNTPQLQSQYLCINELLI